MRTLSVPDFDFTARYYPEILEACLQWLRQNVPELNNESDYELHIQLIRMFSLVGHINHVELDVVAHESLMVTSQLRDSLVKHLKLIGYEVANDVPATAEMVLQLSKTFNAETEVVRDGALFATRKVGSDAAVVYEADEALTIQRTDFIEFASIYDASGTSYTDITDVNVDSSTVQLLPATPAAGDMLYLGHSGVMTNKLKVTGLTVAMANVTGVWEVYDGDTEDGAPDSVANLGSTLKLLVDDVLGTSNPRTGLVMTVKLNETGASEEATVAHDGSNNYVTTASFLGQTTPSTTANDYTVGSAWKELSIGDTTSGLTQNGSVTWTLPKTTTLDWQPGTINGDVAFWVRFRVISVTGTPVAPTVDRIKWDQGDMYIQVQCTQGQTRDEDPLGSGDGTASQQFVLGSSPVIDGSVDVYVGGSLWTEVDNFLNSTSTSEHYTVETDSDGVATVTFGDGTNGKVAPAGSNNIAAIYRYDAASDGNAGANTIIVNRSGLANIKNVTNPRPAAGWVQQRGATAADRELLKLEGPASLRTLERAVTTADIEYLATNFKAADGTIPVKRARATEGTFGPKTVRLICVGPTGATVNSSYREELEEYFNGNAALGTDGVIVANQEVAARSFTPRNIDIDIDTDGGDDDVTATIIVGFIHPMALRDDGVTYLWDFGDTMAVNKIIAKVLCPGDESDDTPTDVTLNTPAANIVLQDDELPVLNSLIINGVTVI